MAEAPPFPPLFVSYGAAGRPLPAGYVAELGAWMQSLPRPRGILVLSAQWRERTPTRGSTAPAAGWRAPGASELAHELHGLATIERAPERGWDEGVWGPLRAMVPSADVPVLQLSLVTGATPQKLYGLGRRIGPLARLGYAIVGMGAVTCNVEQLAEPEDAEPAPFARAFDAWAGNALSDAEMDPLLRWRAEAPEARLANPSSEHLDPLFVVAGAASLYEHAVGFPVRGFAHATVSLRCVQFGRSSPC